MTIKKSQRRLKTDTYLDCPVCGTTFLKISYQQKTCSYKCGYTMQNAKNKRGVTNFRSCARCGGSMSHKKSHAIYCSKTCKSMDHTMKHRSKTRYASVARRHEIYLRDNKKCYMCNKELGEKEFHLDHLIPVKAGGSNDSKNLAVSCPYCNRSRGTKIEEKQLAKLKELSQI